MLHKNRSKNKNQWKYALVIPVLALFLMSFNTKEIIRYEENSIIDNIDKTAIITKDFTNDDLNDTKDILLKNDIKVNFSNVSRNIRKELISLTIDISNKNGKGDGVWSQENKTIPNVLIGEKNGQIIMTSDILDNNKIKEKIIEVIITKDFTNKDFKKAKEQFSKLGVTLKFKSIKRNKDGEIIELKSEFKTPEGNSGNFGKNGSKPISPFTFYYNTDNGEVGYGSSSQMHFGEGYAYETTSGKTKVHTSKRSGNVFVYSSSDNHDQDHKFEIRIKEDDDKITIKNGHKVIDIKKSNKNKSHNVFVISDDDGKKIEFIHSDTIKINKDNIHFNGNVVLDIQTDEDNNIEIRTDDDNQKVYEFKKGNNKFFFSGENDKEPLFILNDKEVSKKKIDNLDSNTIESVSVLKGAAATKLYGKKGKSGVVVITTKDKD